MEIRRRAEIQRARDRDFGSLPQLPGSYPLGSTSVDAPVVCFIELIFGRPEVRDEQDWFNNCLIQACFVS